MEGDQQEALGVGAAANYEIHEDDHEVQVKIKERKISFSSKDGQELSCKWNFRIWFYLACAEKSIIFCESCECGISENFSTKLYIVFCLESL